MDDSLISGARAACASGECEASIALLERAIQARPSDVQLYYRLGICYGGNCRAHSLARPEMAASYLRQALRLSGGIPSIRAAILDQLAGTLVRGSAGAGGEIIRAAIESYLGAAEIYGRTHMTDDWGRTEFNLGNCYCDLSEATGEEHWVEAIRHYENSLRVRTRKKDPKRHAAVLMNLGTAYRQIRSPDGSAPRRAIRCYLRALRIYRALASENVAVVENNLGNAILSLPESGERTGVRNARRALRHFDRALEIQASQPGSRAFGITQYNRAQAYFRLARWSPALNLTRAVDCLEAAGAAFDACGEGRYAPLIRSQLAWITGAGPQIESATRCRSGAGRFDAISSVSPPRARRPR